MDEIKNFSIIPCIRKFLILIIIISFPVNLIFFSTKDEVILENTFNGNDLKSIKNKDIQGKLFDSFYFFSDLAYKKLDENKFFPENYKNWEIINSGGIQNDYQNLFYVLKNDESKTIIIAFPGTACITQLYWQILGSNMKNFDENSDIKISKYFGERTLKIFDSIFDEKTNYYIQKKYSIVSTGHSLGGAIAQVFMYFAITKNKINIQYNEPMTITYSQPKPGNKQFIDFLSKKTAFNLRFLKKNDIVPLIPFVDLGVYNLFRYMIFCGKSVTYEHTSDLYIKEFKDISFFKNLFRRIISFFYQPIWMIIYIIFILSLEIKGLYDNIEKFRENYREILSIVFAIILIFSFVFTLFGITIFDKIIITIFLFLLIINIIFIILYIFFMIVFKIIGLCCKCFNQRKENKNDYFLNFNLIEGVKLIFGSCNNACNKSKEKFETFGLTISCLFLGYKDLQEHSFKEQTKACEKMQKRKKRNFSNNSNILDDENKFKLP